MTETPDYATLIDAETWAFIRATDQWYPSDAASRSVAEQRTVYDAMCRAFFQGHPPGVVAEDLVLAAVSVRRYRCVGTAVHHTGSGLGRVLYLHGGGFVVGGLHSHDDVCAELCARTGGEVVAADYRLAPEHRHPAAYDDALAVAEALLAEGGPLLLVGDSAGGNLAAALSLVLRGRVQGQVLIYPGLGGDMAAGTYVSHADAPMLTTGDVMYYRTIRGEGDGDWRAAPLVATDFAGVAPTLVFSAECDPVCDDGRVFVDRIKAAGGRARWVEEKGLVHGYLRARTTVARARASFTSIVDGITRLMAGDAP